MRWKENFAAILRDKGLNLTYSVIPDENGQYTTEIMVEFQKDGKSRPAKNWDPGIQDPEEHFSNSLN